MGQQTSSSGLKLALSRIAERVADGTTLADAMLEHKALFGDLEVNMVRAGEEGGFLDDALRRLAGVKSSEIESVLGYRSLDEAVHRDDLVVLSLEATHVR